MPITSGRLGRLQTVSRRGADVVFNFESSDLVLTPAVPNVIRHSWVPTSLAASHSKRARIRGPSHSMAGIDLEVAETPDVVRIRCADLVIEATRDPFHLRYASAGGRVLLEEDAGGGLSWSYWDYDAALPASAPKITSTAWASPINWRRRVDLDHRGHLLEMWNRHSPPAATVFPAFVNPRGYGLLVDNPYKALWDLGHSDSADFFLPRARWRTAILLFLPAPISPVLLRTFLELTGFPPHPPRWIFGLLQSRYGYRKREELETIARTFRATRLPCDALILDLFWFAQMGDLAFNPAEWPGSVGDDQPPARAGLPRHGDRGTIYHRAKRQLCGRAGQGYLAQTLRRLALHLRFLAGAMRARRLLESGGARMVDGKASPADGDGYCRLVDRPQRADPAFRGHGPSWRLRRRGAQPDRVVDASGDFRRRIGATRRIGESSS